MIEVRVKRGVVLSYDERKGLGRVRVGRRVRRFFCYWYRSNRPLRPPAPRRKVEVIFNLRDQLVMVREA